MKKTIGDKNLPQNCSDFICIIITMAELDFTNESSIDTYISLIKIMKFLIHENEFFNEFKHKPLDKIIKKLDELEKLEKNISDKKIELAIHCCKK
jgi:hypothetical protein